METLTRLVAESLARHGFDRPVDFRRLQWSRWFRCESHHSLLVVPSKPGVFALAEEIMTVGSPTTRVGTGASLVQPTLSEAKPSAPLPEAESPDPKAELRHMLAVTQFLEDDDMAFVLDRMLSRENPMSARLASQRYFIRYVVIEDPAQRHGICNALNQWIVSSAEKVAGIGSHFASSLEITAAVEHAHGATAASAVPRAQGEAKVSGSGDGISNPQPSEERRVHTAPRLNSAIATNIHCSSSFPSGF